MSDQAPGLGQSSTPRTTPPRMLVVGCGGIGGIVAAHLFEQGHDVTALTTNQVIADAIEAEGFRVRGDASPGTVRGNVVRKLDAKKHKPFDFILLATQPPQVEEAARNALPFLGEQGAMVCFQNGLCEERISAIAGPERTLGGVVAWGASMVEPGVYDRTSSGGFVIGRIDGRADARLDELALLLEAIGPTTVSSNLAGARWSKLAINCAISSIGTVGGERLGALMRHRFIRRLALEIMTETVEVARALGVRLEKVSGTLDLDWIALTPADRVSSGSASLVAKHALLLAVGARYRRLRSSMLAAIERGRPPAVDFLNGEVVTRGAALGIPTPVNAKIRDLVLAIAKGTHKPSLELAKQLYEQTRGPAAATEPPSVAPPPAPFGSGFGASAVAGAPPIAIAAGGPEPEIKPPVPPEAPMPVPEVNPPPDPPMPATPPEIKELPNEIPAIPPEIKEPQ